MIPANGDKERVVFFVQLTTSRVGNHTRLVHTLLKMLLYIYIYIYIKLHITAQSGRVILVILYRSQQYFGEIKNELFFKERAFL